jgi:hypothetical protein
LFEDRRSGGLLGDSPEEDEILVQESVELGIVVKLLTEQFAGPSGVGVKVDEDQLVLDLGFGNGLVQGALEPVLRRSHGGEDKHHEQEKCFFHSCLFAYPTCVSERLSIRSGSGQAIARDSINKYARPA